MACVFAEAKAFLATHPLLFANVRVLPAKASSTPDVRRLK
jgi:hypothetical protein